jgi:hypothetical protein
MLAQAFWLTAILPGLALATFLEHRPLGIFGTLARSYALTVVVLTPLVAVAYALHASIAVVAIVYLTIVGVSLAVWLVRKRNLRRFIRVQHWPVVAAVVLAALAVYQLGTVLHFDALVHIAKVRQAIDAGFMFQDPYSPLAVPETRHMLGVYHAVFSIGAWLTGTEPHYFWFYSAWFFRLLALGGLEILVLTLYPRRRIAAVVVLGALVLILGKSSIVYPAVVAGHVILPLLIADVLRAGEVPGKAHYAAVAMSSIALGAIHVAIWMMAAISITVGFALWIVATDRRWIAVLRGAAVGLALAGGLPFLALVAIQPSHVADHQEHLFGWMVRSITLPGLGLTQLLDPLQFLWFAFAGAAIVFAAAVKRAYRVRNGLLLALLAGTTIVMFVPPVPGLLMQSVPHWVVRRARYVAEVIAIAGSIAGLVGILLTAARTRAARALLTVMALFIGIGLHGNAFMNWKWSSADEHRALRQMDRLEDLLQPLGSGRPMVLTSPDIGLILPAIRELSVMAPPLMHANPADGELLDRSRELSALLDPTATDEQRRRLIAARRIEWVLTRANANDQVDWSAYGRLATEKHGFRLYQLVPADR